MSLAIIQVLSSLLFSLNILLLTSTGILCPSFLINLSSPEAFPFSFLSSSSILRCGSVVSTIPLRPSEHISSLLIPSITSAAWFAAYILPSGPVRNIASELFSNSNLYISKSIFPDSLSINQLFKKTKFYLLTFSVK